MFLRTGAISRRNYQRGSVLGNLLFVAFINYIYSDIECRAKKFDDDTINYIMKFLLMVLKKFSEGFGQGFRLVL